MTEHENKLLFRTSIAFFAISLIVIIVGVILNDAHVEEETDVVAVFSETKAEQIGRTSLYYLDGTLQSGSVKDANELHADCLIILMCHEEAQEKYAVVYYDQSFDFPDYGSASLAKDISTILGDRSNVKISSDCNDLLNKEELEKAMIPAILIESNYSKEEIMTLLQDELNNIFMEMKK